MKLETSADWFAREAAAIAAFESFARRVASEGYKHTTVDWNRLEKEDRQYWRNTVELLCKEQLS